LLSFLQKLSHFPSVFICIEKRERYKYTNMCNNSDPGQGVKLLTGLHMQCMAARLRHKLVVRGLRLGSTVQVSQTLEMIFTSSSSSAHIFIAINIMIIAEITAVLWHGVIL
jgi:hypothetical protein